MKNSRQWKVTLSEPLHQKSLGPVLCSLFVFTLASFSLSAESHFGNCWNQSSNINSLLSIFLQLCPSLRNVRRNKQMENWMHWVSYSTWIHISKQSFFMDFISFLWQMVVPCGTTQSPFGCHSATCPLVVMLWRHTGALRAQISWEAGARRAVNWSAATAAPPRCAALCSATMLCCK